MKSPLEKLEQLQEVQKSVIVILDDLVKFTFETQSKRNNWFIRMKVNELRKTVNLD